MVDTTTALFFYMRILIALIVAIVTGPPIGATLTSARSVHDSLWFSNPSIGVKGTMTPIAGARFEIIVITVGDVAIEADLRQFTLTTTAGHAYEPIAAGGGADLIFPIDSMPLGRELGQILPTDAVVTLTRTTTTTVMIEADPHAPVAFVFQVPVGEPVRALKLPGGVELALTK